MSSESRNSSVYCPHLKEVDNETLQQLFSKVAAVRSQNRELFDFTHREISVFRTTGKDRSVVSEREVYDQFDPDRPKNFAVVIEGEVGTGKSELCAYLAHRLKDEGRPLLHVDKEDDLMTLLSDRLPEFYYEQFGMEMEGAAQFKQLREDIETMPNAVANSATSTAILNIKRRGYDVTEGDADVGTIKEFVQSKLQLLVEKGEFATKIQFVTEQEYKQEDFLQIFGSAVDVAEAVEVFNDELWRVVRERYDTASLSEVLKRIGKQLEDTRPVIVFEDFSITAMEANKLAKFIESDQTESAWDFIIAGTRDSTGPLHTQTAESRYDFYQTNERNSQSVLFLDRDTAVDFVRPYLGYFKSFDESVRYNGKEDGGFSLRKAPPGSRCADCGLCEEQFRDLFPFNGPFLERIYSGMEEADRQSPREYIMTVFDVLSDYYEGKVDVPSNADTLRPLINRVSVADEVFENAETFAHLARWYGRPNDINDTIEIDKRFGIAFELFERDDDESNLPNPVQFDNGNIVVPAVGGLEGKSKDTDPEQEDEDDDDENDVPDTDPVEIEFEDKAPLINSWLEEPSNFKETGKYIERGLQDAIARLTDEYTLYPGTKLEYNISSQKRPFVFSSQEKLPDSDQIVINLDEFRLSDLRGLLRFGIEREKTPRGAGYEALLQSMGTQLTAYALAWRNEVRHQNLEKRNRLYKQHPNYDFADFVMAYYSYVVMIDSPWDEVTADTVQKHFGSADIDIDNRLDEWLRDELEHESYQAIHQMVDAAEDIERMVGHLFGVSSTTLDAHRVRSWFEDNSPEDILSKLGRSHIRNIDSKVRFSNGFKLRDIADTAYDVRKSFSEIPNRYQKSIVDEIASNLDGFSMSDCANIVANLETYDVDPDLMEPLKRFNHLSQETVDETVDAASMAKQLHNGSGLDPIQATLASVALREGQVYQRYSEIPMKSASRTSTIGKRFQEVGDHYVQ
ncbi:ATP-binding protein [Halobacteriaceae bacterium SHR40]|uniref:ATP-binding protein n=1 Tax=Halovenus amylolytica TaxID=2500550 RepID=UPI000FE3AB93